MNGVEIKTLDIYDIVDLYLNGERYEDAEICFEGFIEVALEKEDYSFANGLLGAGWLISYLIKHGFIDEDPDDLLHDFDDNIYKIAIKAVVSNATSISELLELICYYQERIQNKPIKYNIFRSFIQREILKLLVDKMLKIVTSDTRKILRQELSSILLKLSYLVMNGYQESDIEEILYSKMECLITHYQSTKTVESAADIDTLYNLLLTSRQYNNPYWSKQITNLLADVKNRNDWSSVVEMLIKIVPLEKRDAFSANLLAIKDKKRLVFLLTNLRALNCQTLIKQH
ncbi:hypothetical protein [Sphingobacterium sp. GVS05A]|uniref:hypothetical protein n=1 Tax=Sphingobacterium sp. GVS05A TaxID=2862679 RepID=UPI001CBD1CC0|nr:hypothetical protein [Sphingobacterium sp. GVS05A]